MDIKTFAAVRAYGRLPTPQPGDEATAVTSLTGADESFSPEALLRTPEVGGAAEKPDFASVMRRTAQDAIGQLRRSEDVSMQALDGKADVQKLMQAMADAEMTVRTVTAVRDKVLEAYQEIVRMPV